MDTRTGCICVLRGVDIDGWVILIFYANRRCVLRELASILTGLAFDFFLCCSSLTLWLFFGLCAYACPRRAESVNGPVQQNSKWALWNSHLTSWYHHNAFELKLDHFHTVCVCAFIWMYEGVYFRLSLINAFSTLVSTACLRQWRASRGLFGTHTGTFTQPICESNREHWAEFMEDIFVMMSGC